MQQLQNNTQIAITCISLLIQCSPIFEHKHLKDSVHLEIS